MSMSIQAATPTARTSVRFQHKHLLDFALKVTQRDLTTALVCSVRCQFCAYSGREQIPGQKRQRQQTMTVKHWVSPFRTELYKKHHESQHFTQWREYQVLSHDEKVVHFNFNSKKRFTVISVRRILICCSSSTLRLSKSSSEICSFILMTMADPVMSRH